MIYESSDIFHKRELMTNIPIHIQVSGLFIVNPLILDGNKKATHTLLAGGLSIFDLFVTTRH